MIINRVLDPSPVRSLADHARHGGGQGLQVAARLSPAEIIEAVTEAGLRGRGGAGFPTGTKWQTVADFATDAAAATVVVNAAEGEPGSFKDRTLLRRNPFQMLEGALIAARALDAREVVVALKSTFTEERELLESAIRELRTEGWTDGVAIRIVPGPSHYLFGEETALLEVVDGRPPFPRVAPPFRRGLGSVDAETAEVELATESPASGAPATLVNNVETLANVPGILANGPEWYRLLGTDESPGTILVTITGRTERHDVAEVAMGTSLGAAIEMIGGGIRDGGRAIAAMSGVSNVPVPASSFDVGLTYEDLAAAGSGLGAAGFIVFDDTTDFVQVAQSASRFLAVESCGQCEPCKRDGLAIAAGLSSAVVDRVDAELQAELSDLLDTVPDGRRCYLAQQHQDVVRGLLEYVSGDAATNRPESPEPVLVLPIVDIVAGRALLDERHLDKQPDWSFDETDSGAWPAASTVDRSTTPVSLQGR